ncbi:GDSL-type esterase/lipase family protein [Flavobacterium aciduliphilum]|uniref:Lysophospholipase L1-like esterase n=1 Tax=Flavobacterium aciduliphilum TaxID=1101402 RepID=A0A328YEL9_9FLAO|nr:GDSL-type esterase/lipase family protein [Flavobacterium aciduliphilum]RAR71694.1 lysophospholipase L1-like esterase [Flavobacterium aciduliphilum]
MAQELDNWNFKKIDYSKKEILNSLQNRLENPTSLFPLLVKLYKIKHFSNEHAVFVHIGDSHIQADIETAVIRNEFQDFFGNAGRGLVFPYQVTKTNAPYDLFSNSKSSWKWNRVARPDTLISCGVSGFGMESQCENPEFSLELKNFYGYKDTFDKVTLFLGGKISELSIEYENQVENNCFVSPPEVEKFCLKTNTSGFRLSFPTKDTIKFYGASLEKSNTGGIIYHSIGANGATYFDYTKTQKFWNQIATLEADCYIISLGTNEAQDPNLSATSFLINVKKMVRKLQKVSPNACIIITTPPVSYYKKHRPNQTLEVITNALIDFCNENNLVYWDLYNICNGLEGAKTWKKEQLLRSDLVHFSKEGYILQGNLFVDAFSKIWNEFLCKNY